MDCVYFESELSDFLSKSAVKIPNQYVPNGVEMSKLMNERKKYL